jgi:hypothetical protein
MLSGKWKWLVLCSALGCGEAATKPLAKKSPVPASPSSADTSTGTSAKLDAPPRVAVPEQRLRQQRRGKELVIDSAGKWDKHCRIHRPCGFGPRELPVCSPRPDTKRWSDLPGKAEHFTDPNVAVRGKLVMDDTALSTAVGCAAGVCCNGRSASIRLAGPPYDLDLNGLACRGDESRLCCPLSANGEEVIATGRLNYERGRLWLDSPELCRIE